MNVQESMEVKKMNEGAHLGLNPDRTARPSAQ